MWVLVKNVLKNDEWENVKTFDSVEDCKLEKSRTPEDEQYYIFWEGDYPEDPKERAKLIDDMILMNNGKILFVLPGVNMSLTKNDEKCNCPQRCFCVHEGGGVIAENRMILRRDKYGFDVLEAVNTQQIIFI